MSEIERLAAALALADAGLAPIGIAAQLWPTMDEDMRDRYRYRVRAVLLAMREPSDYDGMVRSARKAQEEHWTRASTKGMIWVAWDAMIDHILAEP